MCDTYIRLFTETKFLRWYGNTFFVAVCSCLITTVFVLAVAYAFSRIKFKVRKGMMNVMLILGMFPGFMSMSAVYFLLKILHFIYGLKKVKYYEIRQKLDSDIIIQAFRTFSNFVDATVSTKCGCSL